METGLIILEGKVTASEKQLDLLLEQLHEVGKTICAQRFVDVWQVVFSPLATQKNLALTLCACITFPFWRQAEFMLKRSQRVRSQEDLVLPVYEPLSNSADEGDFRAPLFSVLAALAVVSNDTMWEKLTLITRLFDVNNNKVRKLNVGCNGTLERSSAKTFHPPY